jgi:tetratricopeptide (TPR) repeat protein
MGVVYLAEDVLLGRRVAIKFPNADARYRERLLQEARTACVLSHPAIAAIYDCGIYESRPYVVMELVEGETLRDCLKRGPLPPRCAIGIAAEAAAALAEAHRRNIVHRDIKPSNIRIDPRGSVKVLDFGVAKRLAEAQAAAVAGDASAASTQTAEHTFSGTPRYMSPEQARGEHVDARSDLFSLGVVFWECLTGEPAFAAASLADVFFRVMNADLPPPSSLNPAVPQVLDRITLKALAKDPAQRYQSAEALLEDLESARLTLADTRAPTLVGRVASNVCAKRRRTKILAAASVACLAAVLIALLVWRRGGREPDPQALRWYQEGANAIHDGTYLKAARALRRAVSLDDGFSMAHARLAEASDELDDGTRAREEMLKAVAPAPARSRLSDLDAMAVEAVRRLLTNDAAGAAALYRQILRHVPDREKAGAYLDLGRACEKAGQFNEALSSYRQAARRSPQYAAAFLHLGVLDRRAQRFDDAEADFAQAESLYQALSNTEGLIAVLYQRGVMANKRGNLLQAAALLDQALRKARAAGSQQQEIEALLQLSNIESQKGDTTTAARYAGDATELARASGLQLLAAGALLDLGNAHFARGDMALAEQYFQQSLDSARRFHSSRVEARALLCLGSLHIQQADLASGVRNVEQALRFYERNGDAKERSLALILLARAHRDQGDYAAALSAFQRQLEQAQKAGDPAQLAVAREGAASVLSFQGRHPEALAAYREIYSASLARGDQMGAAYGLVNSARELAGLGRYGEAREALAQADGIAGRSGSQALAFTVEECRIEAALSERHFSVAYEGARKALAARSQSGSSELVELNLVLCAAGQSVGARRRGLAACESALDLARKSGMPMWNSRALLFWADAQLQNGNASTAKEAALSARAQFARSGQRESEARALLVAARASRALRDIPGARSLAGEADRSFQALCQSWTPEDRAAYDSRPDVRHWRKQLGEMVNR